jgi:hypothetical protein
MLKKNLIAIIFLAVLVIIGAIIFFGNRNNTLDKEETDFAIKDITQITSIKIKNSDSIFTINKKDEKWYYNNEFRANSGLVSLCMRIISQVEIKSSIPEKAQTKLAEQIKKSGSEIQISDFNKVIRHFFIWADISTRNTYMMMAEKKIPYLVSLPSFEGNFAAVFISPKMDWHDLTLLEISPKEISYIKVEKPEKLEQSFQIIIEEGKVIMADIKYNKPIKYSQEAINAYFYSLHKVYADKYVDNHNIIKEILSLSPFAELQISDKKGNLTDIKFYRKAKGKIAKAEKDKLDKNRCFAVIDDKQLFICKYVNIDPIIRNLDFFVVK